MLYIIIGPSGAGKTSVMECLLGRRPSSLTRVVTATTRAPRQGEVHGREYLFLSQQEFSQTQVLADIHPHKLLLKIGDKRTGTHF
ncbi:MAG: Guanylate kinase [Firmicutes bacterium]|nr:Guanylate kinase [Bacillota bacterium]